MNAKPETKPAPNTLDTIRAEVTGAINIETTVATVYAVFRTLFAAKWQNRRITRAIVAPFEKALAAQYPGHALRVVFRGDAGMLRLGVFGAPGSIDLTIWLGYRWGAPNYTSGYDVATLDSQNKGCLGNSERIQRALAWLSSSDATALAQEVETFRAARLALKAALAQAPFNSAIERALGLDTL